MSNLFDWSEVMEFDKDLMLLASDTMPKECKKFIRAEGTKLKKVTLRNAKSLVKKRNGKYHNSIKRGRVYKYKVNDAWAVRVYSYDPKAHLIEDGHRIVTKNKVEKGFAQGKKVFSKSKNEFSKTFAGDINKFLDKIIKGVL